MDEDRFKMTVNCDCCGEKNWKPFYGQFWECLSCGVFRNGQSLSASPYPETEINTDWPLMRGDIEKFTGIMDEIESMVPKKRLYDVGCSYGYLLWLAKLRGWEWAAGIDIDVGAVMAAQEMFDIIVDIGEYENSWSPMECDCIVFHHGIEHTRSPMLAIERAIKNLSPSGIIWMAHPVMPNREAAKLLLDSGHQHEWTFDSFKKFIAQYPQLSVIKTGHSDFSKPGVPSQYWVLRS